MRNYPKRCKQERKRDERTIPYQISDPKGYACRRLIIFYASEIGGIHSKEIASLPEKAYSAHDHAVSCCDILSAGLPDPLRRERRLGSMNNSRPGEADQIEISESHGNDRYSIAREAYPVPQDGRNGNRRM